MGFYSGHFQKRYSECGGRRGEDVVTVCDPTWLHDAAILPHYCGRSQGIVYGAKRQPCTPFPFLLVTC